MLVEVKDPHISLKVLTITDVVKVLPVTITTILSVILWQNKGYKGDLREITLQERVWSQYWASLMP